MLGPVPAVALGGLALAASLTVQFTRRRYVAWTAAIVGFVGYLAASQRDRRVRTAT